MTYKEFEVKLDVGYDGCQLIIKKILENFDAKITQNTYDVETIYCDFLINENFKICFH